MKNYLMTIVFLFLMVGCEDVVQVDVPTDQTRLAIDALIRVADISSSSVQILIKAKETSSFFENVEAAKLDQVTLTNEGNNSTLELIENSPGSGLYVAFWPASQLTSGELRLNITYKNEQYEAHTSFVPSVPIDRLIQGDDTLFSGDETEVIISYTDVPNRVDFYLFDFDFDEYLVSEDTFYPGQSFEFSYFYDGEFLSGQEINIGIIGVDEDFYNYMNQIIVQSGGDQGPFQTPSATVRGNIINKSNPDNFALGYFAVSQSYNELLIIE